MYYTNILIPIPKFNTLFVCKYVYYDVYHDVYYDVYYDEKFAVQNKPSRWAPVEKSMAE